MAAAASAGVAAAAAAARAVAGGALPLRLLSCQQLRMLCVSAASCSAIGGRPDPLDITRETTPMLHQTDSRHESEAGAFELRPPPPGARARGCMGWLQAQPQHRGACLLAAAAGNSSACTCNARTHARW